METSLIHQTPTQINEANGKIKNAKAAHNILTTSMSSNSHNK
jgi:hypothetical protein